MTSDERGNRLYAYKTFFEQRFDMEQAHMLAFLAVEIEAAKGRPIDISEPFYGSEQYL